jgi:hypothetical protein
VGACLFFLHNNCHVESGKDFRVLDFRHEVRTPNAPHPEEPPDNYTNYLMEFISSLSWALAHGINAADARKSPASGRDPNPFESFVVNLAIWFALFGHKVSASKDGLSKTSFFVTAISEIQAELPPYARRHTHSEAALAKQLSLILKRHRQAISSAAARCKRAPPSGPT